MKIFTSVIAAVALLAVTGPAVAEEATGTSAAPASSLLVTMRADINGDIIKKTKKGFPDPDELTLLGSIPVNSNENGVFVAAGISNGHLDNVFKKIVHLHWEGSVEIPQDGDFILTMTAVERCANDYKAGGKQFFPVVTRRSANKRSEQSATIEGMSKGEFLEIDFTDFCNPTKNWRDFERHTFALEAFFLKSGESVRLKNFKPKGSPT